MELTRSYVPHSRQSITSQDCKTTGRRGGRTQSWLGGAGRSGWNLRCRSLSKTSSVKKGLSQGTRDAQVRTAATMERQFHAGLSGVG